MKVKLHYLFIVLWIIPSIAINAQTFDYSQKIPMDSSIRYGKLSNGITYYIKKNLKPEKRVELRLAVNAGSILEDSDQLGLAHFTEHMAFDGTKHFEKNELISYLQTVGVRFGADLNAYTGFDETVYMLQIPTDKEDLIEKGIDVLEDWPMNCHSIVPRLIKNVAWLLKNGDLAVAPSNGCRINIFLLFFIIRVMQNEFLLVTKKLLKVFRIKLLKGFIRIGTGLN